MQIIEVRNDILKLAYSPFQNGLLLSDFLLVTEGSKSILAQVIGIESSQEKDINIAVLKGCLSVDETGKINSYVGFTPSIGAEVSPVAQEQVISMLCDKDVPTVAWGYLAQHDNVLFRTEKNILENKPLILMDDYANYNVIANNLVYSNSKLGQKTVLVDFDGNLKIDNAFYITVGEDLKLPLSYTTLNYIYENDLKEESLSTQAIVQDIVIELQEYIKILPENFLPFSTIKNVIYSQYEENKIPELMLFKNKFVKYAQQGIFAESEDDFGYLNQAIEENDIVVIDATNIEFIWHRLLLNYLAKHLSERCSFIVKLEDDNSDKKTILDIYNNHEISPILVSSYSHQCVNMLKSIAKNVIMFPPIQFVNDFSIYSSFIQKLRRDEYVVCGEDTLYLSFLVRLTYINSNMAPEYIEEQIQRDVDKLYRAGAKSQPSPEEVVPAESASIQSIQNRVNASINANIADAVASYYANNQESALESQDDLTEEDLDFLDEMESQVEDVSPEKQYSRAYSQETVEDFQEEDLDMLDELESFDTEMNDEAEQAEETMLVEETLPQFTQDIKDIAAENFKETQDEFAIEEQDEVSSEDASILVEEEIEQQEVYEVEYIGEDDSSDYPEEPVASTEEEIQEDEVVEEESGEGYGSDYEEESYEETVEEEDYQPQPIPVYSVPEIDNDVELGFSEGNMVYHEKYGRGVIEKIMNYGNKTLCSIQFEEVGRRLLDPNLAGLTQV